MNLDLFVTTDCNMKCRFCGAWKQDVPEQYIPAERAKEILKAGKDYGFKYVTISGGEPLMHPDLIEIINCADQLGYWINITTNGLLINQVLLKKLENKKVNIRVSFHTRDRKLHERITGVDTLERVLESIYLLRDQGRYYSLGSTIYGDNLEEVKSLTEFAFENNAAFIRFTPVVNILKGSDINLDEDFYKKLLTRIIDMVIKYRDYLNYSKKEAFFGGDPIDIMTTRRCPAGSNIFMIVDATGQIIPCQFIPEYMDYPRYYFNSSDNFLDLKNEMDDLFSRELLNKLEGKCGECAFKAVCFGGCIGNKLTRGLPLYAEQPLCISDILKSVLKQYDQSDVNFLTHYWYHHFNIRTSINDSNKSCMRKSPIWELNFDYAKKNKNFAY